MKRYLVPIIKIVVLDEQDCICTSVMYDFGGTVDNVGYIPDGWFGAFGG